MMRIDGLIDQIKHKTDKIKITASRDVIDYLTDKTLVGGDLCFRKGVSVNFEEQNDMAQQIDTSRVTRVEVIDDNGRSYVNWKANNTVQLSLQDKGRTLKVFVHEGFSR